MPPIDDPAPAANPEPTATPTPTPAPAADPAPAPAPAADPAPAPSGDLTPDPTWMDGLPDELRAHPSMQRYKGQGVEALAKGLVEVEATLGRQGVKVPGEDATPEQKEAFFNAIGRPETVDQYDFGDVNPPEGMPWRKEADTKVTEAAHAAGLTNDQLKTLRGAYIESAQEDLAAMEDRAAAFAETSEAALKSEWGGDYDTNLAVANTAVKAIFGDALSGKDGDPNDPTTLRLMDGTHVMNHPGLAKAFLQLGKVMAEEGTLEFVQGGSGISTVSQAKAEVARIRSEASADAKHAYNDPKHPENKLLNQKVLELERMIARSEGSEEDTD